MADQSRTIRIPVHMVEVINQLRSIRGNLIGDLGREPTPQELAHTMMVTPERVLEIQHYTREPISLDQTIGEEGDSQLGDFIEDSEAVDALDSGRVRSAAAPVADDPCHPERAGGRSGPTAVRADRRGRGWSSCAGGATRGNAPLHMRAPVHTEPGDAPPDRILTRAPGHD